VAAHWGGMTIEREEQDDEPDALPLHLVLRKLPLFDNLYLNMQAMNIGVTDFALQEMEEHLLRRYIEIERTPTMEAVVVSAWSQMWIFALYELLRTWRRRAKELIEYGAKLAAASPEARAAIVKQNDEALVKAAALTIDGALYHRRAYERIEQDPSTIDRLKSAYDVIAPQYRSIEAVRITLAKHEVPKSGFLAQAPGYGRIDMATGSIYWSIIFKDNSQAIISRRGIADGIRELSLRLDAVSDA
jgi:hypothetical protein